MLVNPQNGVLEPDNFLATEKERLNKVNSFKWRRKSSEKDSKSVYEKILYNLHHDAKCVKDVSLGKRVGFYKFRGAVGNGNFSVVKLAQHQLTRDKVAIKVIEKSKLDAKTQKMLSREISIMDQIGHPNIIRLFEVVESLSRIHLVLEYAPGKELYNRVINVGKFDEADAKTIFSQIISAVVYLHSMSIVHRDIKAENVFMTTENRVKIGDFGFSTRITETKVGLSTFCGSPPYAAPELYKDDSYNGPAVDVWALGVLLFFIITADMPFKSSTVVALKRMILNGVYNIPVFVSEKAVSLIRQLMKMNPKERTPSHEISSHSWFYGSALCDPNPLPSYVTNPRVTHVPELATNSTTSVDGEPTENKNGSNFSENNTKSTSETDQNQTDARIEVKDPELNRCYGEHLKKKNSCCSSTDKTVTDCCESLTNDEILAYKCLEGWGLSREILSQATQHGARSNLNGTYRILMHRLYNSHQPELEYENSGSRRTSSNYFTSGTTTPENALSPRQSVKSKNGRKFRFKRRMSKCGEKTSKTCVIS